MAETVMLTAEDNLAWRLEGEGWWFLYFWPWSRMGDGGRARCGGDGGGYYCWLKTEWLKDYQFTGEDEENQREVMAGL